MDKKKRIIKTILQQIFQIAIFNATTEVVNPTKTVVMAKMTAMMELTNPTVQLA